MTTELDEYTGLACTLGLENRTVYCGGGTSDCKETCSPTSKSYTCANAASDPCDCEGSTTLPDDGESKSPSTTYSLSESNTLDNVVSRARQLLNQYGLNDLPGPNTSGEIAVGSNGQSVLKWSSGASTVSRFIDSRGVVELVKCIIRLKKDINYKIVTIDSSGQSSEQSFTGLKDEIVALNAPTGGIFSQEFVADGALCAGPSSPYIDIQSNTYYSTKTLKSYIPSENEEEEDQEIKCTQYFTGPDCKKYRSVTTTWTRYSSASSSYSASADSSGATVLCGYASSISDSENGSANSTYTVTTRCDGQVTESSTSEQNGGYSYTAVNWYSGDPDSGSGSWTCKDGLVTKSGGDQSYLGIGGDCSFFPLFNYGTDSWYSNEFCINGACCPSITREETREYDCDGMPQPGGPSVHKQTGTWTCSVNGATITRDFTIDQSSNYKCESTSDYGEEGICTYRWGGGSTDSGGTTVVSTYSDLVDEAAFSDPKNYETKNWSQDGGTCAWLSIATDGTMNESDVVVNFNLSMDDSEPSKDFDVYFQTVLESNFNINNCRTRSFTENTTSFVMKGGESVTKSLSINASSNGQTKCLVHYASQIYERR